MKKLLFSLCLLLSLGIVTQPVSAQSPVDFGIRGGVNFANLNDIDGEVDSRTGLMGGLYFNFMVANSPVSIQPEVLYTQKGYELGDDTFQLDYIEIPVLAKFDFITDGSITPNVYFGPYVGFNVNADVSGEDNDFFGDDAEADIEDGVENTDFGVTVGAGLDFGRIDLGVRYGAGLTEIFEDGLLEDNNSGAKNGVFSITAGLDF